MRVAGGNAKGRRLKGAVSPGTRATTERVRAAIFNILGPEQYQGRRVLDLFAGSGSLGIEALSHGAGRADFVEWDRRQSAVITSNLESTGFSSQGHVHRLDVLQALQTLPGRYDLVLLDPPYKMGGLDSLLEKIASQPGLIVDDGVVIAGHSKHEDLKETYGSLRLTSHRQYGDNVIDFFVYEQDSDLTQPPETRMNIDEGTNSGEDGDLSW
ncbi:MAG: 16S rRNA (guanine(966)-N(2))-methyltransferase RsmD [Chloroflexi bacterium]|jgi:16S rRNA (guanine(966)-N(2))-methyltransferase RsmD|nr:16S rRNA (guanine(966)-N(2))-methyltransferase RsmD [Dehalococcoidia bacterium]PKB81188.1 MAG: 16S rRNA (guanine(966)-N(2))-methyltransferase RsmD [SAR202 cluster bacterium MP-SInd-SRR3963457-G1]RUA30044.1 MAG: 16S rRNA (guanine(966)-N(2))-methyltransferase RsmD [Chloroflexota bacterium]|tara:strand:- start:2835 stop:3470 length:636 start_codon:yes stop_codon:yes gene_type:complete